MIIGLLFIIGVLAVAGFVAWGLRVTVFDEARTEDRLRRAERDTVSYAVPAGQDPAVLSAALRHAGFRAVGVMRGGKEHLLVECTPENRAVVRAVIEHVERTGFEGAELHPGTVTFEDER